MRRLRMMTTPSPRGRVYYYFIGNRKLRKLKKRAQEGVTNAQAAYGGSLLFGTCGYRDAREALIWTAKALAAGEPHAKFLYGCHHMGGIGLVEDKKLALRWFKEAAEAGDLSAILHTAWAFEAGIGTQIDLSQSIKWYQRAALAGVRSVQYLLGLRYARGEGVPKDLCKAYFWMYLAIANKRRLSPVTYGPNLSAILVRKSEARKFLNYVRDRINPEVRISLDESLSQWRPGIDFPSDCPRV